MPSSTPNNLSAYERRQYLRVKAAGLRLTFSVVPPAKLEDARKEILALNPNPEDLGIETDRLWHSADIAEKMDDQFSDLQRYLRQLDSKIDYLIAIAEGRATPHPAAIYTVSLMDLSAGGFAFFANEDLPADAFIKITLQITRFPLVEVHGIAQVLWCKPFEDKYEIGAQFETILESDRERLFRFISRLERQMLRERKEARTGY